MNNLIEFKPGDSAQSTPGANRSNDRSAPALETDALALERPVAAKSVHGLRRRIFWTTHGWYLRLRDHDVARSRGLGIQYADVRLVGEEVVAGPFKSEDATLRWFDWFMDSFADARRDDDPTQTVAFRFYE